MATRSDNRRRSRQRTTTPQREPEPVAADLDRDDLVAAAGVLHVLSDGFGFLRVDGYIPSRRDVYVGRTLIERHGLRSGDEVAGLARPPRPGGKESYPALVRVD